jgi:hypothetical protein
LFCGTLFHSENTMKMAATMENRMIAIKNKSGNINPP